ncbi:hypothetical protein ELI41_29640 (plasmid) [Rhizobium leguminosarum]|uniref:hypothetical protein n=1 Tax=Rhizobium leguminosarum TaxID=384 RepID=UPI0010306949|nr:hypothetical protein [Rhizobium leguminosarum]TAU80471.1 hypothetical protein ELI41_29640 [Rhizobium leguminosarum]
MMQVEPSSNGLDTEDDPGVLRDRARFLWEQWQSREDSAKLRSKRFPKTVIKAAAVQLLHQIASAEMAVPYELARLFQAIVEPDTRATTLPFRADHEGAVWSAIRFEGAAGPEERTLYSVANHLREQGKLYQARRESGEVLTAAHEYLVRLSGMSRDSVESTVRNWQKTSYYRSNVRMYRNNLE